MILVRLVFQAKYGRGDELVALFHDNADMWPGGQQMRLLTDLSGSFFTVVAETAFENMAAWEKFEQEEYAMPEFGPWFEKMIPLVESGRREFYHVVAM